jgi:tetratricopeptide (TPR) repeat protein
MSEEEKNKKAEEASEKKVEETPKAEESTEKVAEEAPVAEVEKPTEEVKEEVPVAEVEQTTEEVKEEAPVAEVEVPTEEVKEEAPVAEVEKPTEEVKEEAPVAEAEQPAEEVKEEAPVAEVEVPEEEEEEPTSEAKEQKPIGIDSILEYINENQNSVMYFIGAIVGLIVLYYAAQEYYYVPREKESQSLVYKAQQYFEKYNFSDKDTAGISYHELALNGDAVNGVVGFLEITEDFSGTRASNLSHYYAGIIYLKKGEFDNAIEHLGQFTSSDLIIMSQAYSALGDAYAENENPDEAIKYYRKASEHKPNKFTTPLNLLKLGQALETIEKYSEAKTCYEKIKQEYPKSPEGLEIEKYIARVNVKI